jgi:sporulation protein YlmC with PRC-barrel domain
VNALTENMSQDYRYTLEKGSKKHLCPSCEQKRFVRYVDNITGDYLPSIYGKCDRAENCGYFQNPYSDGYFKTQQEGQNPVYFIPRPPKPKQVFFDIDTYSKASDPKRYSSNTFIQNIVQNKNFNLNIEDVLEVSQLYQLGTILKGFCKGGVSFPFIDIHQNINAVQVKTFDNNNKTKFTNKLDKVILSELKKENRAVPEWLKGHIQYGSQEGYYNCLFGEHLLKMFPSNPVGLVEAPKTAIYCALFFGLPKNDTDLIFLAAGAKGYLKKNDKLKVLQNRFVLVFPDLSNEGTTFNQWQSKLKEYESKLKNTTFEFSKVLEKFATPEQRTNGADIADVLAALDWNQYSPRQRAKKQQIEGGKNKVVQISEQAPMERKSTFSTLKKSNIESINTVKEIGKIANVSHDTKKESYSNLFTQPEPTEDWSSEIKELENYFNSVTIPENKIKLNQCELVTDPKKLIEWNMTAVKANNGNKYFKDNLEALKQLKTKHNEQQN